ncbi:hypothetical protein SISNIDRAFT_518849 [Sistotremastrum niveocremeum HHB9708]|uniref:Uncharacterized protein n=1 Tax=Sistotremastrum niveocremeum HHB9708 TaxID=1314777 RepID=A0A164RPR4_9AGAM|nr:hypothetical protein SISNIDRAFT_518849 [Sistotremastrum niveocremeum HHB9708]
MSKDGEDGEGRGESDDAYDEEEGGQGRWDVESRLRRWTSLSTRARHDEGYEDGEGEGDGDDDVPQFFWESQYSVPVKNKKGRYLLRFIHGYQFFCYTRVHPYDDGNEGDDDEWIDGLERRRETEVERRGGGGMRWRESALTSEGDEETSAMAASMEGTTRMREYSS